MVSITPKRLWHDPLELPLDLVGVFSRRKSGSIAYPEDVRINREGLFAKGRIKHYIGSLPADPGQRLQFVSAPRDLAAMLIEERLA